MATVVGGLSGLMKKTIYDINNFIKNIIIDNSHSKIYGKFLIIFIVSIFDILFANNTIAIIFSGKFIKNIVEIYNIKKDEAASILDIFSCVFQGIIPWAAQILLASSIIGISSLEIIGKVYYCYF